LINSVYRDVYYTAISYKYDYIGLEYSSQFNDLDL
jgi:hypothetical protein